MAASAIAQPNLEQRMGRTVADTGATGWRFERFALASSDGQRYRLQLAIPQRAAPAQGFAAVWMLDGNAALMETDAVLLESLRTAPHPPVLIYVAHDNDLRVDAAARAFDYTPRRTGGDEAQRDPMGRRGGGADAFLDLLTGQAREQVARHVSIDPSQHAIWGHSYGGLFVLHAWLTRPQSYRFYAAIDPSLWWGNGHLLKEAERTPQAHDATLWFMAGEGTAPPKERAMRDRAAVDRMQKARASVPPDVARTLIERERAHGLDATYFALPGLGHGQTLGASLPKVLRHLSGLSAAP